MAEASPKLRVNEDKKQIGRMEPMTAEAAEERMARTVQVCCCVMLYIGPHCTGTLLCHAVGGLRYIGVLLLYAVGGPHFFFFPSH